VGFDDIEMSEFYVPPLTTIRQDRNLLGRRAAETLMARIVRDAPVAEAGMIPVELVVRGSTGPAPAG
jgi:LacI family repressor for deo operon, udp, cdd, tsx, nupC, and nupG